MLIVVDVNNVPVGFGVVLVLYGKYVVKMNDGIIL